MFQRVGDAAVKKDLNNIIALCRMLGDPHLAFPSIHVAGTNGKGSTSHMLSSVFQAQGLKTGLYTSPHYVDFRERIRINGEMISEETVVDFVREYKDQWELIRPSFFEITVAMAFDYFNQQKVDIAIIETGLGGRLDSTNIIFPRMSVITNIGFDHTQMLGETLPQIAFEKAGIIKSGIPVVIGEDHQETKEVFIQKAVKENAPLIFAKDVVRLEQAKAGPVNEFIVQAEADLLPSMVRCDLTGPYQEQNLRTVLASLLVWNTTYPSEAISHKAIQHGLAYVRSSTGMIGRWMLLQEDPLVITDAAHNIDGIQSIIPAILAIKAKRRHFVLGFVSDKEIGKILALFPKDGIYYWCSPDIPRGKKAEETLHEGASQGLMGEAYATVHKAFEAAMKNANKEDFVFVGGSSYVVGNLLRDYK